MTTRQFAGFISRNKYLLLILVMFLCWFGWSQVRPSLIRKKCFSITYRQNEDNEIWAEGKIWALIEDKKAWGWVYPDTYRMPYHINTDISPYIYNLGKNMESRNIVYRQCLIKGGLSSSP